MTEAQRAYEKRRKRDPVTHNAWRKQWRTKNADKLRAQRVARRLAKVAT